MECNEKASDLSIKAKELYVESAARSLEELINRLNDDHKFASIFAINPRETLDKAGINLEKESVELLIASDPERFDRICDKLFEVLDPSVLASLVEPSCAISLDKQSRLKLVPKEFA
jgi:hypothetical protein